MKPNRLLMLVFTFMAIASMLISCVAQPTAAPQPVETKAPEQPAAPTAAPPAGGKIKVGLSFSDFATERWKPEEVLMRSLLEEKGYEVLSQEANHDVKLQNDQIDNMVSQGVKALIIVAEDGDAIVTSVDKAADAGVKVIAYDRLIKTPKIAAYISFNNVEVGRQQALGVMKKRDVLGERIGSLRLLVDEQPDGSGMPAQQFREGIGLRRRADAGELGALCG